MVHGGTVNDSQYGRPKRRKGSIADMIADQYNKYTKKYGLNHEGLRLDTTLFQRPGEQMKKL